MVVMTRAAALRGYAALVDELGGDGARLLGRFDITPAAIDSDDAMIPSEAVGWALEIAAAEFDCPDFGLCLAERQDIAITGPLAVAMANAATVGEALDCASRYLFTHSAGISIAVLADPLRRPGVVALNYRDPAEANGFAQSIDLAVGNIHRALRQAVAGTYGLRSVQLPHPPLAPAARYAEFFDTAVLFGAETALLRIPAEVLARPVAGGCAELHMLAMRMLTERYPELDRTVAAQVRTVIDTLFTRTTLDIDTVARALSVHERTLQRSLAAEGTTFTEVLDGARRDITYRLLCETAMSMSQITELIGLREQSALTRAVRRWFGATPRQVRRAAHARHGTQPRIMLSRNGGAISFGS